jgi:hypothetical protein
MRPARTSRRRAAHRLGPCAGHRRDRGAIGGIEVLPFGLLLFAVGLLFVVNVWAVVDAKLAAGAAAREAARNAVEAADGASALAGAHDVAIETLAAHGRDDPSRAQVGTSIDRPFGRCARVTVTVRYTVPAISLPWIGGLGNGVDTVATHSEVVDPYRRGLAAGGCA